MDRREKKKVAAAAAVVDYLERERAERAIAPPPSGPGPWALAGRLAAVQMGTLLQLRMYRHRS